MKEVVSILEKAYEIDNIQNSKESIFIIDKNKNKNDPYLILNEFDKIKNEFTSIDKKKIQCRNVVIEGNIFEAQCSAFSTLWYDNIP
jgi:phage-related protein